MLAGTLQEILLRNIRLQRFSRDWPAGTVLKTQWGAAGKDPELPSYSSGPAVLSLQYLTSSRETKMDLARAFHVRSPKPRHCACSAVTFPKKSLLHTMGRQQGRDAGTRRCKGAASRAGHPRKSPQAGNIKTCLSCLCSSSLSVQHNVRLFKGPPCTKISFICIYKTVYTDAHTITLWQGLQSSEWEGKDHRRHFITKAQKDSVMETKVAKIRLSFTL